MSAHSKIQKSLGIGAYAPQVFTPSPTGENIKRAVTELGLTGVTICGITINKESTAPALPLSASDAQVLDEQKAIDWRARGMELAKGQVLQ